KKFFEFEASGKSSPRTELVKYLLGDLSGRANVPRTGVIDTRSNLTSEVLREIIHTLGIDYTPYELKEKLIDAGLVKNRNEIAHGKFLPVTLASLEEIYSEVKDMMILFHNQLVNAAQTAAYQRT